MSTYDVRRSPEEAEPFVLAAIRIVRNAWPSKFHMDRVQDVLVAGTLRRETPDVGDIDLVVVTDELLDDYEWADNVHATKKKAQAWIERPGEGRMYMDAWRCPTGSCGPMMLFLTGPPELNVFMRQEATKRGLLLNQYGLYHAETNEKGKVEPGKQVNQFGEQVWAGEEEICDLLGLQWLLPRNRNGWADVWSRS